MAFLFFLMKIFARTGYKRIQPKGDYGIQPVIFAVLQVGFSLCVINVMRKFCCIEERVRTREHRYSVFVIYNFYFIFCKQNNLVCFFVIIDVIADFSTMHICSAQPESFSCDTVRIVIAGAIGNLPAGSLNLLLKLGREIILSGFNCQSILLAATHPHRRKAQGCGGQDSGELELGHFLIFLLCCFQSAKQRFMICLARSSIASLIPHRSTLRC